MNIKLIRADSYHAGDYIRIGLRTTSRFNHVSTRLLDVMDEISSSVTYMIEFDSEIVGFISYTKPKHIPDQAYIAEVQVDPDFQGRGIGGAALGLVLREIGAIVVDLHTHPENPAQRLYGRYGFRATGEIIKNYHETGEPRMRMVRKPKDEERVAQWIRTGLTCHGLIDDSTQSLWHPEGHTIVRTGILGVILAGKLGREGAATFFSAITPDEAMPQCAADLEAYWDKVAAELDIPYAAVENLS